MAYAKAALPTIGDPIAATQLANFAKSTAVALGELRDASDKVSTHLVSSVWDPVSNVHFSCLVPSCPCLVSSV